MDSHKFFRIVKSISSALHIAYGGANRTKCPHCGVEKSVPILPLQEIVICKCEQCQGYVVPFAGYLLPLGKSLVENHTHESELRFAVVQVIMKELHTLIRKLVYEGIGDQGINPDSLPNTVEDLLDE